MRRAVTLSLHERAPSVTANSSERTFAMSPLGKYTSLIAPLESVYQTFESLPIAVPSPCLRPVVQFADAPGAPGATLSAATDASIDPKIAVAANVIAVLFNTMTN